VTADLAGLVVSVGPLTPAFAAATILYGVDGGTAATTTVTATVATPGATLLVDGDPVASGVDSAPIALVVGANPIAVQVTAPDLTVKTYTVIVARVASVLPTYVKASAPMEFARFGGSVALDGDTLVVGASFILGGVAALFQGEAYVFVRTAGVWSQQALLQPAFVDTEDEFGYRVAISGDTIVVGAWREDGGMPGVNPSLTPPDPADDSAPDAGAAYVFVRSGTTWTQQAYLKASNPDAGDRFGGSVAVHGDTVVVGAFGEDSGTGVEADDSALDAGAVYVFVRSGTAWSQQAYLKAPAPQEEDFFGTSVALSGETLGVGMPFEDGVAMDSGAVYVLLRSGATWSVEGYLKASNPGAMDAFGAFVSVDADTLVVGALQEDGSATGVDGTPDEAAEDAGAAYVFVRSAGAWSQQAYLKATNTEAEDYFGISVSVSGDVVVVGARWEDGAGTGIGADPSSNGAVQAGAAYAYVRSGATWAAAAYLKASNTDPADEFGISVAVSGATAVVGAHLEYGSASGIDGNGADNSFLEAGAAYVFTLP
jgi:hypothetical protein